MSSIKSVVVYTPYCWEHALVTLRIVRPLQEAGVQLIHGNEGMDIHPEYVTQADAILLQREFPENLEIYERILKQARIEHKPVIYEVDDLLFELPKNHLDYNNHYYSPALFAMLRAVIEADLVTTSSAPLRDYLQVFNSQTVVLPNYLDESLWKLRTEEEITRQSTRAGEQVTIGYMGTNTHQPDLELITTRLAQLLDGYQKRLLLRFWGAEPPDLLRSHAQVEWQPVKMDSYAEFAAYFTQQSCDLFVAPLVDSKFNRCKSAIKFLEYSSLGVPGVYSRIAPYQTVIEDGQNGFLASTNEDWERCLVQLIESPELRIRMGLHAQETVSRDWLLSQHAGEWTDAYQRAMLTAQEESAHMKRQSYMTTFIAVANQVRSWQNKMYDQLIERDQKITTLQDTITRQEAYIQQIGKSRGWKLLQTVRRWKTRLFG